jgi:hypothetical protein
VSNPIQPVRAIRLLADCGESFVEGGCHGRGLTGDLASSQVIGLDSRHEADTGPGNGKAADHQTDEGNQESATHFSQPSL